MKFEEFFEQSKDRVLRAVVAATGDQVNAEDLAAEAFARAFERWDEVKLLNAPSAWVVRSATNLHIDRYRKSQRFLKLIPAIARPESYLPTNPMVDQSLVRAINNLPERQKQVVCYRVLLELSAEETGREMGITVGAVGANLSKALKNLRNVIELEQVRD